MKAVGPVAVVCHFPPPPGGMPGQAELLVRCLGMEGVRAVRVRTNLGSGPLAERLDQIRGLRSLIRLPLFLVRLVATLPWVRVVHVFSHSGLGFFLFTVPAVVWGRLTGRRVVVNYHGGGLEEFLERWGRLARPVFRLAGVITVPSGFLLGIFRRESLRAEVVPNVCELDAFQYRERASPDPVLLVARHLEAIYDVTTAIGAFALVRREYPRARLLILGGGSEATRLRDLAASLGVSEAVEFAGYVPHERIAAWYDRATVFLNTSRVDNLPIAILEAFAAGLPVVTTRAGGIPYLVEEGVTGLLAEVGSPESVAGALRRLLENPVLAGAMAARARDAARSYEWSNVWPRLERVYRT